MVQDEDAGTVPENPWFVAQESANGAVPPDNAPATAMEDAVVEAAGASTTSSSGAAGGGCGEVGVDGLLGVEGGAGTELSRDA